MVAEGEQDMPGVAADALGEAGRPRARLGEKRTVSSREVSLRVSA